MIGQVHWLPFAALLLACVPVVFLFVRSRLEERKYKVERHHIRCRASGNQLAQCTLVRDAQSGTPIGIRECSVHPGAEAIHCEKTCLPLFVRAG